MPRVLLVTYPWLPAFNGGVKRAAILARYLPDAGWDPIILTRDWSEGATPADAELRLAWGVGEESAPLRAVRGVPVVTVPFAPRENAATRLRARVATARDGEGRWSPVRLARRLLDATSALYGDYPDAMRGWAAPAVQAGVAAIRQWGIGAVVSISPPDSAHVAAGRIARRAGVPWIPLFDDLGCFRVGKGDGRTTWERLEHRELARRWLRGAARAGAASPAMAAVLRDEYGVPCETIALPFDPEERRVPPRRTPGAPLRLVHVGHVVPGRQHADALFDALDQLIAADPRVVDALRVQLVGSECDEVLRLLLAGRPAAAVVEVLPRVSPAEAVVRQREADVLLLLDREPAVPGAMERYPATLFELVNARRPIVALAADDGYLAQVLAETRAGEVATNAGALAGLLGRALEELRGAGELAPRGEEAAIARYGGPEQARRLGALLDAASAERFGSWQRG